MLTDYILSCESTVDLPYDYVNGRGLPVLFYSYMVDGVEYPDDMMRDPEALPRFYRFLSEGKLPTTSQINEPAYEDFFEEQLKKGDLLHIFFGSGMTASIRNARQAAEIMKEKYPQRRLIVVDSTCSCCGYGLLVDMAADLRDGGMSMEDLEAWLLANRRRVNHQFYSTDLKYFRRSGRVSGPAAMIGTMLNLCPLMRLDDGGRIVAYDKVRGKRNALRATIDAMEAHAQDGADYSGKCFIGHSNCPEDAALAKEEILARFPHVADVRVYNIGTIIASHCGPGTLSVYFMGDERPPQPEKK